MVKTEQHPAGKITSKIHHRQHIYKYLPKQKWVVENTTSLVNNTNPKIVLGVRWI
jgi:hypothetical protein